MCQKIMQEQNKKKKCMEKLSQNMKKAEVSITMHCLTYSRCKDLQGTVLQIFVNICELHFFKISKIQLCIC